MCPACLSLLSSNLCWGLSSVPQNLRQDCKNGLHAEEVLEFCREFEEISGSLHQVHCEEQMEESFNNKHFKHSAEVPEREEACKEGNIPEIESVFKENERDEDECTDPFQDGVQYCTNYDHSPCNATEDMFKSTEICESEEVECNKKETISTNSLMEVGTITSDQKVSCSEENRSIQKKITSSFFNKEKIIPAKDSAHKFTDVAIRYNINEKTSKAVVLKSQDQFKSKTCRSFDCECYPKNRKIFPCNCKIKFMGNESKGKVHSSRNNNFGDKEISFFDGWNNLKNALGLYIQNRIFPISSKAEQKRQCACKCTPADLIVSKFRKMNLNEKEKKDIRTQNSPSWSDFCLKVTNNNPVDSFQNSEKYCNRRRRSKIENWDSNKEVHKVRKNNNDNISVNSDCTIYWSSDRTFINTQSQKKTNSVLNIDMQPKGDTKDNIEISCSGDKTDDLFPVDSAIIRNEDTINSMVDVTSDNLNESSSNECLVHPGKDNFTSECEFRRNDNDGRVENREFKQKLNFSGCPTSGFGGIKKNGTFQDSKHRTNLFQSVKFTTSKVQKH